MLIHEIRDSATKSATWPTVTVHGNGNRREYGGKSGDGLDTAVKRASAQSAKWPTPCASDHIGPGKNGADRDRLDYAVERGKTKSHLYPTVGTQTMGGKDTDTANCRILNPDWVEWLMGWPLGWTDIAITSGVFYLLDLSDDPADWTPPLMQRITTRKKHRAPRIETLGNGQVPLCAAVAFVWGFEILRVIIEGDEIGFRQ